PVKKRTQRARKAAALPPEGVADERGAASQSLAEDREIVRQAARELLNPRQRRVLQLSFEGWSVQDIAARLGLPAARVSDEKYKAVHRLRNVLGQENARTERTTV